MNIVDQLIKEAEEEALLDKKANDANGAPDTSSNQEQGGGDILTTANAFLQKVEQFKAALGENVAAQGQQQVQQQDPNAQAQSPETQQQVGASPTGNGEVTIARPDGTVIKLAALAKLASARGSKLFSEV